MTIQDALTQLEELKPNQFGEELKIKWLSDIEGKIYDEIISKRNGYENIDSYTYDINSDYDTDLNVPDRYAMIYIYYLMAMIDFANGETERYSNSMQMFNSSYQEFVNYWYKTHTQRSAGCFRM